MPQTKKSYIPTMYWSSDLISTHRKLIIEHIICKWSWVPRILLLALKHKFCSRLFSVCLFCNKSFQLNPVQSLFFRSFIHWILKSMYTWIFHHTFITGHKILSIAIFKLCIKDTIISACYVAVFQFSDKCFFIGSHSTLIWHQK